MTTKTAYITVAILVFLVFIVVMAPASLVTQSVGEDIRKNIPGLKLGAVNGRIWQGSVQVQYHQFPPVLLSWDILTSRLLTGNLATSIELEGDGLQVDLDVSTSSSGGLLENVEGTIDSQFINTVSVVYGLDLTGVFELVGVRAAFNDQWLTALEGQTNWSGGIVHIENPEQFYSVKLPALVGQLSMKDSAATLDVVSGTSSLLTLSLKPDGWSKTSVSYRLMDMAGLPIPNGYQDTTEPAIVLEEKVF